MAIKMESGPAFKEVKITPEEMEEMQKIFLKKIGEKLVKFSTKQEELRTECRDLDPELREQVIQDLDLLDVRYAQIAEMREAV